MKIARWWMVRNKGDGQYVDAIGTAGHVWAGTIRFRTRNAAVCFVDTWLDRRGQRGEYEPVRVLVYSVRNKRAKRAAKRKRRE